MKINKRDRGAVFNNCNTALQARTYHSRCGNRCVCGSVPELAPAPPDSAPVRTTGSSRRKAMSLEEREGEGKGEEPSELELGQAARPPSPSPSLSPSPSPAIIPLEESIGRGDDDDDADDACMGC